MEIWDGDIFNQYRTWVGVLQHHMPLLLPSLGHVFKEELPHGRFDLAVHDGGFVWHFMEGSYILARGVVAAENQSPGPLPLPLRAIVDRRHDAARPGGDAVVPDHVHLFN